MRKCCNFSIIINLKKYLKIIDLIFKKFIKIFIVYLLKEEFIKS